MSARHPRQGLASSLVSTNGQEEQSDIEKLRAEDVTFVYRPRGSSPVVAVERVTFGVAENEFLVLVGTSGCGKSTLLRLVAGLLQPSEGRILLDGQRVDAPAPDRGMVFQSYTLFPWLTVRENVEFGSRFKDLRKEQAREISDHFIKVVGLEGFEDSYPRGLSGGMQQRVAIARALANDPAVLLMDEPFGALDAQTRSQMQDLLLQVWESERKTVVFVTHDVDEAILLADRVLVMSPRPGRIREEITVQIPRPRSAADIFEDRLFIEAKREILDLIHPGAHRSARSDPEG